MNTKNPWDNTNMNEKEFFNWLRSVTRRIWSRHPQKNAYKKDRTFKAPIGKINNKMVNACKCEMCGETFRSAETEIDHIVAGGSFKNWKEYTEWAKRILWVTSDDIRILCKDGCHKKVTYAHKHGLTLEDADVKLKTIADMKKPTNIQIKELTDLGYPASMLTNAKKRRECYEDYYSKAGT